MTLLSSADRASMRPRRYCRGDHHSASDAPPASAMGFNEAAALLPRRSGRARRNRRQPQSRFNEAAALLPRRSLNSPFGSPSSAPLQGGRGVTAAEIIVRPADRAGVDPGFNEAAALLPRRCVRERHNVAAFEVRLQ